MVLLMNLLRGKNGGLVVPRRGSIRPHGFGVKGESFWWYDTDMPHGQNFFFRAYNEIRKIPKGKVATYGQIAALVGSPRASQQVGWALAHLKADTNVPWQRVINREGRITIENMRFPKDLQAKMLEAEGVSVELRDGNFFIDLEKYLWDPE